MAIRRSADTTPSLDAALAKAQQELHNPKFDSVNPAFRSKFASLAEVRDTVIPVLSKHGLSLTQWALSEQGLCGCTNRLAHSSGEWLESDFMLPIDKPSVHGYISILTYCRRVSMQGIANVVGDEDDDGNAGAGASSPPSGSAAAVKKDEWDKLTEDEKVWVKDLADLVKSNFDNGSIKAAWEEIEHQLPHLPPNRPQKYVEYRSALWHLLDSKVRTALTKYAESVKKGVVNGEKAIAEGQATE